MSCIHHYNIIQNCFTTLKLPSYPPPFPGRSPWLDWPETSADFIVSSCLFVLNCVTDLHNKQKQNKKKTRLKPTQSVKMDQHVILPCRPPPMFSLWTPFARLDEVLEDQAAKTEKGAPKSLTFRWFLSPAHNLLGWKSHECALWDSCTHLSLTWVWKLWT